MTQWIFVCMHGFTEIRRLVDCKSVRCSFLRIKEREWCPPQKKKCLAIKTLFYGAMKTLEL